MKKLKDISEFSTIGEAHDAVLKAPNGRKSALPKSLYNMVRTPEFKAWFGDWENDLENSSKVVDNNGEPMLVYHGTPAFGFKEFINDLKMSRTTDNETNTLGIWFTNDRRVAEEFMFSSEKGGIYEVFVNIRNPKVFKPALLNQAEIEIIEATIKDLETEKMCLGWSLNDMTPDKRKKYDKLGAQLKELYHKMKMLKSNDSFEQFMNYRDKYADYGGSTKNRPGAWLDRYINTNKKEANLKLVKELMDSQHDGFAIVDTQYDAPNKNSKVSQYCVFDPKNIKSADNNGRFGTDTSNIYEGVHIKSIDIFDI